MVLGVGYFRAASDQPSVAHAESNRIPTLQASPTTRSSKRNPLAPRPARIGPKKPSMALYLVTLHSEATTTSLEQARIPFPPHGLDKSQ